jgi:hypothetical protein
MSFVGVNVNKLNTGTAVVGSGVREMAVLLAIAAADLPAGLAHYEPHLVLQSSDAAALGLTASFDANKLLTHTQQLGMFFKYAPEARINIIAVPSTLTVSQAVVQAEVLAALRLVPAVTGLAIAIPADVTTTFGHVEAVQAMVNVFAAERRLFDFVLLPAKGNAVDNTIANYPDMRTKVAPNVSVSIAQDPAVAKLDAAYAKYADWGSVLGMLAIRKISESLGSVDIINKPDGKKGNENYPLTDGTVWADANLSDGKKVNALSAVDKKALTDKGYIYAGSYDGYDGVYFNSSPTCIIKGSDYAYIERNCVWNETARIIRNTLLPKVKGKVKKDPTTGFIASTTIATWYSLINKNLETLQAADEISGFSFYINPKQIISESSPVKVKATVVHDDIAYSFDVDLGYSNSI